MEARCPKCGRNLAADAPQGMCAACLLAAALNGNDGLEADRFLSPTTPVGKAFQPTSIDELRPLFPALELISLLGFGGMGAVYKARQTKLDRVVALKIIRPDVASDPNFAERFNREARTMARLSHPGIVGIHDFGEVHLSPEDSSTEHRSPVPIYYFVMEYVDGTNLRHLMASRGLSAEQSLAIVPQLCEALQYAHDEGVVHRDIKPENILLDQRGRVKIADFGLAKLIAANDDFTLTGTHQVMGTPRYMAPEQMEGSRAVDHRADIYSLGVVFYEMLTGQVPAGHFDPPSHKVNIDHRLDSIVLKAMARDPERRFQAASDVRSEVSRVTSSPMPQDAALSKLQQPATASGEPAPQALSEFLSYEARAVRNWVAGSDTKSAVPVTVRLISPILALACFVCLFFPCLSVTVTEPRVQLTSQPSQVPGEHPVGFLAGVSLLVAFVIGLVLMGAANPSRRLAVTRVSVVAASVLLLLLFRISVGAELVHVNFTTNGASTLPVPMFDYQIRGNSGSGRAVLSNLRRTTELTSYGAFVAASMLGLLVLSVISLKSTVVGPATLRGTTHPREKSQLSHRELAARLMTIMGVVMAFVGGPGLFLGMLIPLNVSSGEDLSSVRIRGTFLASALLLNLLLGTVAIASGRGLLRGTGVTFAKCCCVACMLFCSFSLPVTWPLAIWSLLVLNRIPSSDSGDSSHSQPTSSSAVIRAAANLWASRDVWSTRVVEVILIGIFVVTMLTFVSFEHSFTNEHDPFGGIASSSDVITFGTPSPWLEMYRNKDGQKGFGFSVRWFASSMWLMLAGVIDYWIYWQIQKAKPNFRPDQILSPKLVILAVVALMLITMASGYTILMRRHAADTSAVEQRNELLTEVRNGNAATVLRMLEFGADPNVFVENHGTPLFWAVNNGDPAVIQALLNHSANPDRGNPLGVTPLMVASLKGDLPTVNALLASGANVNQHDGVSGGFTIFPRTGSINWPGQQMTALMLAISGRYRDVAQRLLDAGADPMARDADGRDAMAIAEQLGYSEIVDMLKARAIPALPKQPDQSFP